jgi:hypothetical protein
MSIAPALEKYFEYRKRCGEHITENTFVFRGEINYRRNDYTVNLKLKSKPIFVETVSQAIHSLQLQTGLKDLNKDNGESKPHLNHGFRKYNVCR